MPTPATALLDFESGAPAATAGPTLAPPPKRGPYESAVLRSIRKRERETLGHRYGADGELRTVDGPTLARLAHLRDAGLHDGTGLTAAGRKAAAEVNRALDRLAAGISFDRAAVRARPLEPQARPYLPPVKSTEECPPRFLYQAEATPAANENLTVWWGTGEMLLPGPAPRRYAPPAADILPCERMRELVSRHEKPPGPGAPRIVPVAVTDQHHRGFGHGRHVWLSNGGAVDNAHLAAILHEHGKTGPLVFTTDERNARAYCAWTRTEHGWRRLAIMSGPDEDGIRNARATAAAIDDWLERLLASHAGAR